MEKIKQYIGINVPCGAYGFELHEFEGKEKTYQILYYDLNGDIKSKVVGSGEYEMVGTIEQLSHTDLMYITGNLNPVEATREFEAMRKKSSWNKDTVILKTLNPTDQ